MRSYKKDVKGVGQVEFVEFDSLGDFRNYITTQPTTSIFKGHCQSMEVDRYRKTFTQTESFDEAMGMFTNGWTAMSTELTNKLNLNHGSMVNERAITKMVSVQGFQPIVPLYLAGVPQNMFSTKFKPMQKKVITIDKDVCYSAGVDSSEIVEESTKALAIVKKLESQNYRVNLNIVFCPESFRGQRFCFKIKIKNSNERLNIGKMSFPLVHPSMLRRLLFRLEEVYPNMTSNFVSGYGHPMSPSDLVKCYSEDFVLPRFITTDISKLKDVKELYNK